MRIRHPLWIMVWLITLGSMLVALAPFPGDDKLPQRVILRVSRNLVVKGIVELEEDDVIVVRDLAGEIQSYFKAKINRIIRLVDPAPEQDGIIVLLNGQSQEGRIIEDSFTRVVFEIEGIRSEFRRDVVDYVLLEPTTEENYRRFKESLTPNMQARHFRLCQWLFEKKQYELARKELAELLGHSNMDEARKLLTFVDAQLAMMNRDTSPPKADAFRGDGESENPNKPAATGIVPLKDLLPDQLLTKRDVNVIKVMEIDFRQPPAINISPDTVRKLIETYRMDDRVPVTPDGQTRLFRAAAERPLEVLRLLFELQARDLYPEVKVLTEPRSLNLFRQRIHNTWLINSCATRRCHGGLEAGRFFLHRKGYKNERVRYTNFLILDRLELDPEWPLINYQQPRDSLIIQYGLRRDMARKPHPDVRGWRAVFTKGNSRLLENAILWIQSMMNDPRPAYPVEYIPPGSSEPVKNQSPSPENPNRTSR